MFHSENRDVCAIYHEISGDVLQNISDTEMIQNFCIYEPNHRKILTLEIKALCQRQMIAKSNVNPLEWTIYDVYLWLCSLPEMKIYAPSFLDHDIDGFVLSCVSGDEMMKTFNIKDRDHRKRLIFSIRTLYQKKNIKFY